MSVPRIWIGHDIGQCINPVLAIGQIEGSVYMGLGEALMEEMTYRGNRNVVHRFPSFLEYKSPTTMEMCDVITYLDRRPGSERPVRGQGSRTGTAVAGSARDCQRDLRRGRGSHRRGPDHARQSVESDPAKAKGQEGRYGPTVFPHCDMPASIVVPTPGEGGDGKAVERKPVLANRKL